MKTVQKVGGVSALICAATYIQALVLLTTVLAPMANEAMTFDQFIAFFLPNQVLIFIWHFAMCLVNGTFLALWLPATSLLGLTRVPLCCSASWQSCCSFR